MALVGAVGIGLQRNEDLGGRIRSEPAIEHADHRVRLGVEDDGAPRNCLIAAKARGPHGMSEDRHVRASRAVFIGGERAAQRGRSAEHAEVIGADVDAAHLLRPIAAAQIEAGTGKIVGGNRVEGSGGAPGHELGNRLRAPHAARKLAADSNQPLRVRVGQRLQEDAVDDGEDGSVGADADRQRRDRDGTEPWIPDEQAEGIADVACQSIH